MLRSRTRPISWKRFRSRSLVALLLATLALAVVFYSSLAVFFFGLPRQGTALTVALLSGSTLFLIGGVCGVKRGYRVSIGFPNTPIITAGPLVVFQSWFLIGLWAVLTLLIGYSYLSQ